MQISRYRDEIEAIIPGVFSAYEALKTDTRRGIYTSNGAFYNHTFFARDASMAAKFVTDFDHAVPRETILALAALQGAETNEKTQESLGRIHHELRDFRTWKGAWTERFLLRLLQKKWGGSGDQLLTYFAADSTALYVRLVNKYVMHVDRSLLDVEFKNHAGELLTVRDSVAHAANWLVRQVDENGHFKTKRTNDWALPYQTFADSSTAFPRPDGHLANYRRGIAFTEVQAFACDALEDATRMLPEHKHRHTWQAAAHRLRDALLSDFWNERDGFFVSSLDSRGRVDMPTVSAGWTLNTSLWDEVPANKRAHVISSIVTRLFSDDFLTPLGLRTRSVNAPQPLPGVIEYHGRLTVWPMFTFMVIEGLRRHHLFRLATQLENRLINGINAVGGFEEYFVVDAAGHLLRPSKKHAQVAVDAQMIPEQNIAFTVIPALVLAWRATNRGPARPKQDSWQQKLEDDILANIDHVERMEPSAAHTVVPAVVPTKFRRFRGNIRSAWYFLHERRQM